MTISPWPPPPSAAGPTVEAQGLVKRYGEVTFKTDMWSWGVSMIEMFAGDIYWTQGSEAWSVLDNLLMYGSRYDIIPVMPRRFESLLKACFQDDPDRRPGLQLDGLLGNRVHHFQAVLNRHLHLTAPACGDREVHAALGSNRIDRLDVAA